MERKDESRRMNNSFLGKKTKKSHKTEDNDKTEESSNSSLLLETTLEISSDNILPLEEETESKGKIPGFDDLKIPSFLNDSKINYNVNKTIEKYSKIKEAFDSPELTKLYLIDINKVFGKKTNC